MLIDFRPHARLRGQNRVNIGTSVSPLLDALAEAPADLSGVRVVCDWVQYRENFRDIVDVRPILPGPARREADDRPPVPVGAPACGMEIAVDVRRSGGVPLKELAAARLRDDPGDRMPLEDWGPGRDSCIWAFNALYWSALELWEKAAGRSYEQALPGGESDARNHAAARDLISDLFALWDPLAGSDALPAELYVAELGVGNGTQAKVFLDEFRALDRAHGRGYYRRLQYLMCDYSPYVLDLARETVAEHASHISSVALDATRPGTSLGFLRGRAFLLYISNVYDNLPTDEIAQLGGRSYAVQTRAYFPADAAADLAASVSATPAESGPRAQAGAAGPGPARRGRAPDVGDVGRGGQVLAARLVRAAAGRNDTCRWPGLDLYPLAPTVSGEVLRPLLESGADIRMHVSNGAVASFTDSLLLLHPLRHSWSATTCS